MSASHRFARNPSWLATALLAACSFASAQDTKTTSTQQPKKGEDAGQKISGVVVKVEQIRPDDPSARGVRLTIKTDAVWRDFVRDQANVASSASNKKAAAKGENSVATKGQPASADTLVVVDVRPETKL